ncbi:MAG: hypothetical protein ACXVPQ_03250 [Bacteroidia bacterium]
MSAFFNIKWPGSFLVAFISFCFVFNSPSFLLACQCPGTSLSLDECAKYELIFRGRIDSVVACQNKRGEAYFTVMELYKGTSRARFKIIFDCELPCTQAFNVGEEWIIYTRYKQINNAQIDWCSRSRKRIKNEKEDFYLLTYDNTYDEELNFLRGNLGKHTLLKDDPNLVVNRNQHPDRSQMVIYLLCSIAGMVFFYYLFNRFFK